LSEKRRVLGRWRSNCRQKDLAIDASGGGGGGEEEYPSSEHAEQPKVKLERTGK